MMMDILMYLFETYIHSDAELQVNQDELEEELLRAGFHQKDIYKALVWLEELAALQQSETHSAISVCNASNSTRIYTAKECERLSLECRGFLTFLEQVNVLTTETREMVIDPTTGSWKFSCTRKLSPPGILMLNRILPALSSGRPKRLRSPGPVS